MVIPLKTNMAMENPPFESMYFLFKMKIFRSRVSFQECTWFALVCTHQHPVVFQKTSWTDLRYLGSLFKYLTKVPGRHTGTLLDLVLEHKYSTFMKILPYLTLVATDPKFSSTIPKTHKHALPMFLGHTVKENDTKC